MLKKLTPVMIFLSMVFGNAVAEQNVKQCGLIVIAKAAKIGENPRMISGARAAIYRLATFEVIDSLKGHPAKTQIIVAHLVLTGNELENIRVGDKVLLCLNKPHKWLRDSVYLSADYDGELMLSECNCRN
jgi:hypothetical protein